MSRHGENIFKRKDKRWEGRFICGRYENGRAKYRSVYAHSYAECRHKLSELKSLAEPSAEKMTVAQLFDVWLESRKNAVKPSTYVNYKTLYENYVGDVLGGARCENISAPALYKYISWLLNDGKIGKGGLSAKSASLIIVMLKSMFAYGESEYGLKNPAGSVSLPKEKTKDIELFDDEEMKELCAAANDNAPLKIGVALCLNTGMRIGEICALTWADIDFSNAVLHVRRTIQRIKNPEGGVPKTIITITEPKSRRSSRDIPIPGFLIPALREIACDDDCYFLTGSRSYTEPRCLLQRYKRYLEELGIKYRKFHSLRHTFATMCIRTGIDVKTLSELLGHSNVQTTLERYVHSDMDIKRIQLEKLAAVMTSRT